jgi:protein-S-isoprenylcysteine O-methyltransferase Ste14
MTLLKSLAHNVFVVLVGFVFAFLCSRLDALLGIPRFASPATDALGWLLLAAGFALRVWAAWYFYEQHMKVISLEPQGALVTSGPFAFSRNPLYLGGNVFVFFGAMLVLGTTSGLVLTAAHLVAMDRFIGREERQLASTFGEEWTLYSRRVRRWL